MPIDFASPTASDEGADTAATMGMRATGGLLHDLVGRAAGDEQHVRRGAEAAREQRPPDDLVDRVVPAHVLAEGSRARPSGVKSPAAWRPPVALKTS
jgi:hypothetical protein